jgi:hypothetical protein
MSKSEQPKQHSPKPAAKPARVSEGQVPEGKLRPWYNAPEGEQEWEIHLRPKPDSS